MANTFNMQRLNCCGMAEITNIGSYTNWTAFRRYLQVLRADVGRIHALYIMSDVDYNQFKGLNRFIADVSRNPATRGSIIQAPKLVNRNTGNTILPIMWVPSPRLVQAVNARHVRPQKKPEFRVRPFAL